MRPRMYGSTDITVLRTRTWPSASSGSSTSVRRKFSGVGAPWGREARWISRMRVGVLMVVSSGVGVAGSVEGQPASRARRRRAASAEEAGFWPVTRVPSVTTKLS